MPRIEGGRNNRVACRNYCGELSPELRAEMTISLRRIAPDGEVAPKLIYWSIERGRGGMREETHDRKTWTFVNTNYRLAKHWEEYHKNDRIGPSIYGWYSA